MHELYELKDMLLDKLKEYGKKGDLTAGTLDIVDKLSHATKNLCKVIDEYEGKDEYSRRYPYYDDGHSYDGRSYAMRKRDNMGRYSRAGDDMVHELRELMNSAPDEHTRQEFQKFIQKMEQM